MDHLKVPFDSEPNEPDFRKSMARFRGSFVMDPVTDERALTPLNCPGRGKRGLGGWIAPVGDEWDRGGVWKSAFIEFVATALLCYLSGLIDTTIMNFGTGQGAAFAGVLNVFLLTLFIMAAGPGSGGHVNQTITFATMVTGLTGFFRGILYLSGQTIGAALAGGVLRGSFGHERSVEVHGGGCFRDSGSVTVGQALLIEITSSFALIFLAFGVGLDPQQKKLFGMFIGPLAVGCSVGLSSFASAGLVPGYTGASMHPGRCFAFAISRGNFKDQWIFWVGPMIGALLFSIVFRIAPPYHSAPAPGQE